MRKAFIPCLALCAILASCSQEDSNTNVTPEPPATTTTTTTPSDSADYFIRSKINGVDWECRGFNAIVSRQHVGTATDTLTTYTGQANVAGIFTRVYVRIMNFTDTGYVDFSKISLEVRKITGDKDYNDSHIYTNKPFNAAQWGHIEKDNDTLVEGVFSGWVYTDNLQDSLELSWGSFKMKLQ